MNENITFETYFNSPIYLGEVKELINPLIKATDKYINESKKINIKVIKQREKDFRKKIGDFGLSYHSTTLLNDNNFDTLKFYIDDRALEIFDHMGYDLTNYKIKWSEFWVQEFAKNGGGNHEGHIHYNTHLSGFYFLKCSDRTSFPVFHDPRPAKLMSQLPLKNKEEITLGSEQIHFKIVPGALMLFPSFLEHQFVVDAGVDPFRFIHFNLTAVQNFIE
jgi:uncharacterized protein (TIGR02466 family)